jgi:hypothetical protein
MAGSLFTSSDKKRVTREIGDFEEVGDINVMRQVEIDEKFLLEQRSKTEIKSPVDVSAAKIKLASDYTETKLKVAQSTVNRHIASASANIDNKSNRFMNTLDAGSSYGVESITNNKYVKTGMDAYKSVKEREKQLANLISSVCEGVNDLVGQLIDNFNELLDKLSFDELFDEILNNPLLSDLLQAMTKCKHYALENKKKLNKSIDKLVENGNIETYTNIVKSGVVIPPYKDKELTKKAMASPVAGTTTEQHKENINTLLSLKGETPSTVYKYEDERFTDTDIVDSSSEIFKELDIHSQSVFIEDKDDLLIINNVNDNISTTQNTTTDKFVKPDWAKDPWEK